MAERGSPRTPAEVRMTGGGVAALETLMALNLAVDRVRVTLVAPEPDSVYRPQALCAAAGAHEQPR